MAESSDTQVIFRESVGATDGFELTSDAGGIKLTFLIDGRSSELSLDFLRALQLGNAILLAAVSRIGAVVTHAAMSAHAEDPGDAPPAPRLN